MSPLVGAFRRQQARTSGDLGTVWRMGRERGWIALRICRLERGRLFFMEGAVERSVSDAALERDGAAWCSRIRDFVYSERGVVDRFGADWRGRVVVPVREDAALAALGLAAGATEKDVRAAYRRRAKVAHPDAGGTEAKFIELRRNYERALAAVGAERGET